MGAITAVLSASVGVFIALDWWSDMKIFHPLQLLYMAVGVLAIVYAVMAVRAVAMYLAQ